MGLFIKLDGINGECQEEEHKDWIHLESISFDITRPGYGVPGKNGAVGHVTMGNLVCDKLYDRASPRLAESICKGKTISTAEIHCTATIADGSHTPYLTIKLEKVLITQFAMVGGPDGRPRDHIALSFETIEHEYTWFVAGEDKDKVGWKQDLKDLN